MSDSNDHTTPPMGIISDPGVQHVLERTWKRIDLERQAREDAIETIRKKLHDANNDMAKIHTHVVEHVATSDGEFERLESAMTMQATTAAKMETLIERMADRDANRWKWALGQVAGVAILVVGAWVTISSRVAIVESQQVTMREKVNEIDRALDKIDDRLDAISDRIGQQGRPDAASSASKRWSPIVTP